MAAREKRQQALEGLAVLVTKIAVIFDVDFAEGDVQVNAELLIERCRAAKASQNVLEKLRDVLQA